MKRDPFKINDSSTALGRQKGGIKVADWNYKNVQEPLILTSFIIAISIFKIAFHHTHKLSRVVPESCLLILIGIVLGFIFYFEQAESQLKFLLFDSHSFFLFLLPPIILESAYSLRDRAFLESIGSILLYAIVGTLLNIAIIGPFCFLCTYIGFARLNLTECLIFASLISAVDPVAVLSIFQEVGVNKMLYFMVFGESLFNDAVTVVAYNLFVAFEKLDSITFGEISLGFAAFLSVSFGGLLIGCIFGLLTAYITKFTTRIRVVEPIVLFGLAYMSYLVAELVKFSGIISIICCGIVQSHYAVENISSKSYISVHYFSKVSSAVTESLIFIILGVTLVTNYKIWTNFNFAFSLWALFLCIVARFAVVFVLAYFVNRFCIGMRKVTKDETLIIAYGGLRGAVTFSLAFMFEIDQGNNEKVVVKDVLLTSSYLIILFTVFVQGITLKPLVKLIRIQLQAKDTSLTREINRAVLENTMAGLEEIIGHRGANYWTVISKYLSQKFIRPLVQKFPYKKGGGLVTTFQEVSMQNQMQRIYSDASMAKQSAIWNQLELFDAASYPAALGDLALDAQDEITLSIQKERKEARARAKAPPLKLDNPSDFLELQNLLLTPPHKKVHYVMDKNLTNDSNQSLSTNIRHIADMRRKSWPHHGKSNFVNKQLIQSSLLSLGMGIGAIGAVAPSVDAFGTKTQNANLHPIIEESETVPNTTRSLPARPVVPCITLEDEEGNFSGVNGKEQVKFSLDEPVKFNCDPYEDIPFLDKTAR